MLTNTYQGNTALFLKQEVAWTTGSGNEVIQGREDQPRAWPRRSSRPRPSARPPLYVQGISVSAKSENLPLALAFAKFVTDNANQVAFIKLAQGFLPGTTAAANGPVVTPRATAPAGDAAVVGYQEHAAGDQLHPAGVDRPGHEHRP